MSYRYLKRMRQCHAAKAELLMGVLAYIREARSSRCTTNILLLRNFASYIRSCAGGGFESMLALKLFQKIEKHTKLPEEMLRRYEYNYRLEVFGNDVLASILCISEEVRIDKIECAIDHYLDTYLKHMMDEAREIFPLAVKLLSEADWGELESDLGLMDLAWNSITDNQRALMARLAEAIHMLDVQHLRDLAPDTVSVAVHGK